MRSMKRNGFSDIFFYDAVLEHVNEFINAAERPSENSPTRERCEVYAFNLAERLGAVA